MTEANEPMSKAVAEAMLDQAIGKKWYVSKTFWTNVLAAAIMAAQVKYGFIVPAEYQMFGLSAINLVLRKITKEPVIW